MTAPTPLPVVTAGQAAHDVKHTEERARITALETAVLGNPHSVNLALLSDTIPPTFATEAAGIAWQAGEIAAGRPGLQPNQIVLIG